MAMTLNRYANETAMAYVENNIDFRFASDFEKERAFLEKKAEMLRSRFAMSGNWGDRESEPTREELLKSVEDKLYHKV